MRRLLGASVIVLGIVGLGLAQVILPGIAASRLRDRLARSGRVLSVTVSAFPAIELLWHHAGRIVVRMASYHSSAGGLDGLLGQTGQVGSISGSIGTFQTGRLALTNVRMTKAGDELSGSADVTEAALRAAVPFLQSVRLIRSGGGTLTLAGTATVLGLSATVSAAVRPDAGRLVVVPDLPLVGGIATITVFADPHITVQGVGGGTAPGGLALSARARLR